MNEHLKNQLRKFTPDIQIKTDVKMENDKNDDNNLNDISIDETIPKHPADTSRAASIIEVLKISDNLLGTPKSLEPSNKIYQISKRKQKIRP